MQDNVFVKKDWPLLVNPFYMLRVGYVILMILAMGIHSVNKYFAKVKVNY